MPDNELARLLWEAYRALTPSLEGTRWLEWGHLAESEKDAWRAATERAKELCKPGEDAFEVRESAAYDKGYADGVQAQKNDEQARGTLAITPLKKGYRVRVIDGAPYEKFHGIVVRVTVKNGIRVQLDGVAEPLWFAADQLTRIYTRTRVTVSI
jgi:hypothetical protein